MSKIEKIKSFTKSLLHAVVFFIVMTAISFLAIFLMGVSEFDIGIKWSIGDGWEIDR